MAGMVIIGAGMAGHRAVISLRANNYDGAITLIGEEPLMPYDRPPLSKAAIADEAEPQPLWLMDEGIAASLRADVRRNVKAVSIDRAQKAVTLSNGQSVSYDKLLLATGAKPRKLSLPGGEQALLLRNFEDAVALRQRFAPGKHIVIIGGGFIGLELASSATKRGSRVTVIEAQPRILMRGVPEEIARIVHDRHLAAGVVMMTGTSLASLAPNAVVLPDGRRIAADTIVAGIGAAPDTTLAAQAGLALDNGIAVNSQLQTSDENIYAAGDCCSFPHGVFGERRVRLEAWRNAQDQGTLAGENMLGAGKAYRAVPWFWSDQYDLSLQVAGLADAGTGTVARRPNAEILILFHLADDGTLKGVSAIGPGNSIARDVKLAEMLIARGAKPDAAALADPAVQLKALLKG
jgi:3-phenylpropionate/trans-cinnamate dioxygenase ferredoxin reductase subunit